MEKRIILFAVLSSFVLIVWSYFMPKPLPAPGVATSPAITEPLPKVSAEEKEPLLGTLFSYFVDKYEIIFDENHAAVQEVIFKDYQSSKFLLTNGFLLENTAGFKRNKVSSDSISFLYSDKDKAIIKQFFFHNNSYYIELEINIQNLSNKNLDIDLPLVLGTLNFEGDQNHVRFQDVVVSSGEKIFHPTPHKDQLINALNFVGIRDRYFCAILEQGSKNYIAFIKKTNSKKSKIGIEAKKILIKPGEKFQEKFKIYLGPQLVNYIAAVNPEWATMVNYGTFDIISQTLLKLLDIIFSLVRNWGLAIIILSVAIYFILFPLSIKQMRAMKEMQVLQPRIEGLRNIYKDNPQKLNKEIMELYREHKVSPLGGCLPLILQMPIFFALYQALMRSILLKGAKFLWIKDLSEPDKIFRMPFLLPFLGEEVNLLPILMMIGMFIQQKTSTVTSSGTSNEQQKIMLIVFPLMFGFIFYHMPAGLVLYWLVNSVLMLIYQIKITRLK